MSIAVLTWGGAPVVLHLLQSLAGQLVAGVSVAKVTMSHTQVGQDDSTSGVVWPVDSGVDIQGFLQ